MITLSIIEEFINRYPSKKTQSTYKTALRNYLESLFDTRDFSVAEDYFSSNRDYKADLETYCQSISSKPPLTIRTFLAAVKGFLEYNDVELKQKLARLESVYEATAEAYKLLDRKELEKMIRDVLREEKGS